MPAVVVERETELGDEIDLIVHLVFESRHEVRGLVVAGNAEAFEGEVESDVRLESWRRMSACEEREIDAVVIERRIAHATVETSGNRKVERRFLDEPVFAVRADVRDTVVDSDAAFDVEVARDAVPEQRGDAEIGVAPVLAE